MNEKPSLIGVWLRTGVSAVISIALVPASSWAREPMSEAWIDQAPTVEQIFKDIKGTDLLDARARQAAAFETLVDAIETWTGQPSAVRRMTPRAAAKAGEYRAAIAKQPYDVQFNDGACTGDGCIRSQFFSKKTRYEFDMAFNREVLGRYFAPEYVQAHLDSKRRVRTATSPSAASPKPGASLKLTLFDLGVLAVLAGIGLCAWVFRFKNSEYQKRQEGDSTVFEVTPATAPKFVVFIVLGVIVVLVSIHFESFLTLAGGAVLIFFGWVIDTRPRGHKFKSSFRVSSSAVEVNGRSFKKDDIHRLIIRNAIAYQPQTLVHVGSPVAQAGSEAGAAHRRKLAAVAYSLELESGGKAFLLAGGMDETTAYGLKTDVSKILGFQTPPA